MKQILLAPMVLTGLLAASQAQAEPASLSTRTGNELGLSLSSYSYKEPGVMSLRGSQIGFDLQTTKVLQEAQFVRGDLRIAGGQVDYDSYDTGSSSGEPNVYIEIRGLLGHDFSINGSIFALYTGLGYRNLYHDGRGVSSTGHAGYRRESQYLYLPLGVIHRMALSGQARLVSTLEYDHLLTGKQISKLSDAGLGFSNVTNTQSRGYGLKGSIQYETGPWAVGPYVHYWDIGQSDIVAIYRYGALDGYGWEPKNNTVEFGLKSSWKF